MIWYDSMEGADEAANGPPKRRRSEPQFCFTFPVSFFSWMAFCFLILVSPAHLNADTLEKSQQPSPSGSTSVVPALITNMVRVVLPSLYTDVQMQVDGRPAEVVDRTLSFSTIRVVGPQGIRTFKFTKDSEIWELSQMLLASQPQITIQPFVHGMRKVATENPSITTNGPKTHVSNGPDGLDKSTNAPTNPGNFERGANLATIAAAVGTILVLLVGEGFLVRFWKEKKTALRKRKK